MAYEIEKSFEALKGGGPIAVGPPSFAHTAGPIKGSSKGPLLPVANGAPSLSQVAERYLTDPSSQRTSKSLMIYRTTFEVVCSIVGPDTPIDIISRETCRDVLAVLQCLPSNARKRFPGMTPREAAANAQANGITAMSAANVNEYLNKLSTLLNWAVREEMIARNPARGLRIADTVAARDKRRPFTPLQLQRIFDAPLYRGCRNDKNGYATPGDQKPKRARYWIPLIALFSGMRQNEICQLHTVDAREVEGVLCFVVCADSDDDKHLKTAASQRLVPVHPILIRLGIIGYIADRRRARDVRLFPELQPDFYGLFSGKFSTWFRRFLEASDASADRTCFHSFRHSFRDALREAGVDREVALAIGGWTAPGSGASAVADTYGSGYSPKLLASAIATISYPKLELSHLYQNGVTD